MIPILSLFAWPLVDFASLQRLLAAANDVAQPELAVLVRVAIRAEQGCGQVLRWCDHM
jgi:hypothetical protein